MAEGKVGDGYIDIGAEGSGVYKDVDNIMDRVERLMEKQAQDIGRAVGDAIGDQLTKVLTAKAQRAGKKAGDAFGDSLHHATTPAVERVKEQLDDLEDDLDVDLQVEADTLKARRELMAVAHDRFVNLWVRARTSQAAAEIIAITKGLSGFSLLEKWRTGLVEMLSNLPLLTMSFAKWGVVIGALLPPLMSLLSIMAPLGAGLVTIAKGAVVALPALLATATVVGVVVAAFRNLDKASGEAKRFYTNLQVMKGNFSAIQKEIQKAFFRTGEFNNAMFELNQLIISGPFRKGLKSISSEVASVMASTITGFTEAFNTKAAGTFFRNLAKGLENSRQGLSDFASGFATAATKGSGVFGAIGDQISEWGERFREWSENADISGMISNAAKQFSYLWSVLKNLGGIISGVFKGMDVGRSTGLESMADTLGTIRGVVEGEGFQTAMKTVFSGAAAGAILLRSALGPLGAMFETLAPTLGSVLFLLGDMAGSALTGIAEALSQPVVADGIMAGLQGIAELVRNMPWNDLGAGLGAIGQMIGQLAPVIGSFLQQLAPLLPTLLSGLSGLIGPLGEIITNLLPAVVPIISAVVPLAEALVEQLSNIAREVTPVIVAIAQFTAGLLSNKGLIDGLVSALVPLVGAILGAVAAFKTATVIIKIIEGIKTVWMALSIAFAASPIGAIISLIALLVAGLIYFFTQTETGKAVWQAFVSWLQGAWEAVSTFFTGLWNGIVATFNGAAEGVSGAWQGVADFFTGMWEGVSAFFTGLWQGITDGANAAAAILQAVWDTVTGAIQTALAPGIAIVQAVWGAVQAFWGFIVSLFQAGAALLGAIFDGISTLIIGVWTFLFGWIGPYTQSVFDGLVQIVSWLYSEVSATFTNIWNIITTIWNAIAGFLGPIIQDVVDGVIDKWNELSAFIGGVISAVEAIITAGWNLISDSVTGVVEGIVSFVTDKWNALSSAISTVIGVISGTVGPAWEAISSTVTGVVKGIVDGVTGFFNDIRDNFNKATDAIKNWKPPDLGKLAKDMIDGLVKGIKGAGDAVVKAIGGVVNDAISWAKSLLGISSPSKVFESIGQDTGKGYAAGVTKSSKAVKKAVSASYKDIGSSLGTELARGVAESVSKTSSALGKVTTLINKELARIDDNVSKKRKKSLKAQAAAANKLIEAQRKVTTSLWKEGEEAGTDAILSALNNKGQWISSATKTMRAATLADIAQAREVMADRIKEQQKVLESMAKEFEQMRDRISSNLVGTFQLKGAPSADAITTRLSGLVGQAKSFAGKLQSLIKMGYPAALVQQVAGLGFVDGAKVADVLMSATTEQVGQIQSDFSALTEWSQAAGTAVADQMYGAGILAQEGLIKGLEADMSKLEAAGERIATALTAAVKKKLGIKSPSKVFYGLGEFTIEGLVGGVEQGKGALSRALTGLASMMTGGFSTQVSTPPQSTGAGAGVSAGVNGTAGGGVSLTIGTLTLTGENPKVAQAVKLLMEIIGDVRRYERAGWTPASTSVSG